MNKKIIISLLLALVAVAGQGQTKTSALIRGRIINVPKGHEDRLTIHYTEPLQTMSSDEVPLQLDSLGRFEVEVPLQDTAPVFLVWARLLLSPGETYDVEMDGGTGNVIVKGKDAQLSNEIIAHQPSVCTWDMDWMKTQTDAVVIDEAEKELKRLQAVVGTLVPVQNSQCRASRSLLSLPSLDADGHAGGSQHRAVEYVAYHQY
jgi:hypothetical protein